MAVAAVVTLPLAWVGAAVDAGPGKGLGIALLSSVLPYSLELIALRRLSARVFGILLSLEPAVAALAGLLVLGQRLTRPQLVGMALVVAASALVMGARERHRPRGRRARREPLEEADRFSCRPRTACPCGS